MAGAPLPFEWPLPFPLAGAMDTGLPAFAKLAGTAFAMVADRADLHDRRLRLLQHQLFINRPDLGLFLVSLLTASAGLLPPRSPERRAPGGAREKRPSASSSTNAQSSAG